MPSLKRIHIYFGHNTASDSPLRKQCRPSAARMSLPTFSGEGKYSDRWLNIWKEGLPPGQAFDGSRAAPSLRGTLESGELSVKGKRVLVPGCGRGYDVVLMAEHGATPALGLELSEDAVKAAEDYRDNKSGASTEAKENAKYSQGDFYSWTDEAGPLDIAYDYTFLCAMQPQDRKAWAQRYRKLIKPGGQLATLMFPVDASRDKDQGPPFALTPELYTELLTPEGFTRTYFRKVEPEESHDGRQGKEYFAIWSRNMDD